MSPHTDAGAFTIRLEARPADDSHDWVEIYPAQLQWMAKEGNQVRAIEVAASHGSAGGEAVRIPKVRTSHHRNAEEAARLQAIVAEKYALSPPVKTGGEADTSLQNPQTSPERPDPAQAAPDREAIARIIDPRNFEMNEISASQYTSAGIKEAFRKADAVIALALPSAHRGSAE